MAAVCVVLSLAVQCAAGQPPAVAVFPLENLTGGTIPGLDVRQFLIERLVAEGATVLTTEALDAFMARHRIRYAAGIDAAMAAALKEETGVQQIVIASIELSSDAAPPKFAMIARLVSITGAPTVVWADDVGVAGDQAPGLFELGVVNDYTTLETRAVNRIAGSLVAFLKSGMAANQPKSASKFRPKTIYRSAAVRVDTPCSIAVVPFFNLTDRRNAGAILSLLFIRHLSNSPAFRVVDAGVVRQQFLEARIILDGGLSLTDADMVASLVDADYVLGGRVVRYQDYEGPSGTAKVDFSVVLIEKKTRKVVWSSDSYNDGSDGVRAFERGTSRTAHAMATQMVRLTTDAFLGRDR